MKTDLRIEVQVGLAAEADPYIDLRSKIFDIVQLVLSLLADPQGVRRRIDLRAIASCRRPLQDLII